MSLDWIKTARRPRAFDGHLFPKPPGRSFVLDIRRLARAFDCEERMRDFRNAWLLVTAAAVLSNVASTPLATLGMALLMAAWLIEAFAYLILYFSQRRKSYDLALRQFLDEERQRIHRRARILNMAKNLSSGPVIGGYGLCILSLGSSPILWLSAVAGAAALFAAIQMVHHYRVTKPLRARLEGIHERIAQCDAHAA